MNWTALMGVAIFGTLLVFGLTTGTMPKLVPGDWNPDRGGEPGWFWFIAAAYAVGLAASLAAFVGLIF